MSDNHISKLEEAVRCVAMAAYSRKDGSVIGMDCPELREKRTADLVKALVWLVEDAARRNAAILAAIEEHAPAIPDNVAYMALEPERPYIVWSSQ